MDSVTDEPPDRQREAPRVRLPRLNKRWLWASAVTGATIVGFGALADALGWPGLISDVSVNLGTAVGLAGVLVAYQRRLESRTDAVERRVDAVRDEVADVRAEVAAATQGSTLRSRPALLDDYRTRVAEREPAELVPEERVLAEHQQAVDAMAARQAAFRKTFLAERPARAANPLAEAFLSEEIDAALDDAGLVAPALYYVDDPLDPTTPVRDWWSAIGPASSWEDWDETVRARWLPHLSLELRTRLEMATLYAATADAATGLRVFHLTARAMAELLAIALDVRLATGPSAASRRPLSTRRRFDTDSPADELEDRVGAIDQTLLPPVLNNVCRRVIEAVRVSEPSSRKVILRGEPRTWQEIQSGLLRSGGGGRLFQSVFRQGCTMVLVESTATAIRDSRAVDVEIPKPGDVDLSPATTLR